MVLVHLGGIGHWGRSYHSQCHGRWQAELGGGRRNGNTGHTIPIRGHQNDAHNHVNPMQHKERWESSSGRWLSDGAIANMIWSLPIRRSRALNVKQKVRGRSGDYRGPGEAARDV